LDSAVPALEWKATGRKNRSGNSGIGVWVEYGLVLRNVSFAQNRFPRIESAGSIALWPLLFLLTPSTAFKKRVDFRRRERDCSVRGRGLGSPTLSRNRNHPSDSRSRQRSERTDFLRGGRIRFPVTLTGPEKRELVKLATSFRQTSIPNRRSKRRDQQPRRASMRADGRSLVGKSFRPGRWHSAVCFLQRGQQNLRRRTEEPERFPLDAAKPKWAVAISAEPDSPMFRIENRDRHRTADRSASAKAIGETIDRAGCHLDKSKQNLSIAPTLKFYAVQIGNRFMVWHDSVVNQMEPPIIR